MPRVDAPLGAAGDDPFVEPLDEHGYRAGTRFDDRAARRPRRAAVAGSVLVLAGALLAALDPSVFTGDGIEVGRPEASAADRATPLPLVSRRDGVRVLDPFPILAGELRWVDPESGRLGGDAYGGLRGQLWALPDGGVLCACRVSPWTAGGTIDQVTVIRWDGRGREVERGVALELVSPLETGRRDPIQRDATRSPDAAWLHIGWLVADEAGWRAGIDAIRSADLAVTARLELGRVTETVPWMLDPVLRISPDGTRLRMAIRWRASVETGWRESVWLAAATAEGGLRTERLDPDRPTDVPEVCDGEAWATPERYVLVCRRTATDTTAPFVRLESLDGRSSEVAMGDPVGRDTVDWALETSSGTLYRWSAWGHTLVTLDVSVDGARPRALTVASDAPRVRDRDEAGGSPLPFTGASPRRADDWASLTSPGARFEITRLLGLPGGQLAAIGIRASAHAGPSIGEGTASTGVWVFDPGRTALVDHWLPQALYETIGLTAAGHLVAAGLPGLDAAGRPADWSASLTLHRLPDGRVDAVLGGVMGATGYRPILLPLESR